MRRARAVTCAALLAVAAPDAPAFAQAGGRVVIVRTPGDDAIVARVQSELSATAFELIELPANPATARAALAELAVAQEARAALRVRVSARQVELWTGSADEAEPGALDVVTVPDGETHRDEVLALRAVETLRARSLGPVAAPASSAREPQAPAAPLQRERVAEQATDPAEPQVVAAASEDREQPQHAPQLSVELGPSIALSSGGLGAELGAWLGVKLDASQLLAIGGFAVAPLWRADLVAEEGRASISTWLLGAAIDAQLHPGSWTLSGGVGIASVLTQMSGSAALEGRSADELETSAAPLLRVAAQLDLGAVRAGLRGMLGFAAPLVSVRFQDRQVEREVASWGRPFALISLAVELPLARL